MPSSVSWLDSTPEEQRAARELIAMFSDRESRDELGIGPIRDAFSDLLFPGTSVLQTRARYYLFVPWCYLTPDVARARGRAVGDRGRMNERTLIKSMRSSGAADKTGLIGARAGVNVRNLPSDIYWNGMIRYGIRSVPGPIGSIETLRGASDGATEVAERRVSEWNEFIPRMPEGFPAQFEGDFALTPEEASWLRDRIAWGAEGTLLAHLLERQEPLPESGTAPWLAAPTTQFDELHHARMFSAVMHGAALLYNVQIAQRYAARGLEEDDKDLVGSYRERLKDWYDGLAETAGDDLDRWDLDRMWEITRRANPNIHPRTKEFVADWVTGLRSAGATADRASLRRLVEERERRKGAQSRLKNEKMLAAWSGASGTAPLTFRWSTVRVIVDDILRGLDRKDARP